VSVGKKPYEKALKLATNTENLSVQAEIQAGLGIAYRLLGNKDEAIQWLKKAKGTYNQLGDTSQVQKLDETINFISPPTPLTPHSPDSHKAPKIRF
jgi:tetratricopeptide (TPR) repeat protein